MAKAGDKLAKNAQDSLSNPFKDMENVTLTLADDGFLTIAHCAIIASQAVVQKGREHPYFSETAGHYTRLALLDIDDGVLDPRHPLTQISHSEYNRMIAAGMFGPDGTDLPNLCDWLVPLDEIERWLQSKDIHINFDEARTKAGGPRAESKTALTAGIEALAMPVASANGWQSEARVIADECFDFDTRNSCRDSLRGYCRRVMEEMQKKGIKGPRGVIDNPKTIMREALQGKQWWANKQK